MDLDGRKLGKWGKDTENLRRSAGKRKEKSSETNKIDRGKKSPSIQACQRERQSGTLVAGFESR